MKMLTSPPESNPTDTETRLISAATPQTVRKVNTSGDSERPLRPGHLFKTIGLALAIIAEATLSYLGVGMPAWTAYKPTRAAAVTAMQARITFKDEQHATRAA
jgi:hypothetical protein